MRTIVLHVFEKCMLLTSLFRFPARVECRVCVHAVVFVLNGFSFSRGPRGFPLCHTASSAFNVWQSSGIPITLPPFLDLGFVAQRVYTCFTYTSVIYTAPLAVAACLDSLDMCFHGRPPILPVLLERPSATSKALKSRMFLRLGSTGTL